MDFSKSFGVVKQHPAATAAVVLGGGLVFFLIFNSGGGGSASTAVTGSTINPAQVAADAQIKLAGIQSQTALGAAQIAANSQHEDSELQSKIADLSSAIKLADIAANKDIALKTVDASVTLGSLQSNNDLEALRINNAAQGDFFTNLINILRPATSNTSTPATTTNQNTNIPTQAFDPFNTSNGSQPLFQGYDAIIAQEIDAGKIKINNGIASIVGDNNSPAGTYVLTNPYDSRWNNYQVGTYANTGGTGF
jgi:hypothetical protein